MPGIISIFILFLYDSSINFANASLEKQNWVIAFDAPAFCLSFNKDRSLSKQSESGWGSGYDMI